MPATSAPPLDAPDETPAEVPLVRRKDPIVTFRDPGADPGVVEGLLPMSYHVAGAPHRGTQVRLVRAAPSGDSRDLWCVHVGPKMLTSTGQAIDGKPFWQLRANLQRQVAMPWDLAIKLARKAAGN